MRREGIEREGRRRGGIGKGGEEEERDRGGIREGTDSEVREGKKGVINTMLEEFNQKRNEKQVIKNTSNSAALIR